MLSKALSIAPILLPSLLMGANSNKNFVVYRSSAGSGKTYTLVKEYLTLALSSEDPMHYRHILAITFTNKAAGEMKERVLEQLYGLGLTSNEPQFADHHDAFLYESLQEATGLDGPTITTRANAVLEKMLHNYSDLAICTIDKFVHRIIRSFARDLHIAPDFEVELEREELLKKAIDLLVSKVGDRDLLTQTLVAFTEQKASDDKSWHIEYDLLDFAKNLMEEDSEPYLGALKGTPIDQFFSIRERLAAHLNDFEANVQQLGRQGLTYLQQQGLDASMFFQTTRGLPGYFKNLASLKTLKPNSNVIKTIEQDKWTGSKADSSTINAVEAAKPKLTTLYQNATEYIDQHLATYELFKLLEENLYSASVMSELDRVIDELKDDNNLLLISDFNRMISDLIREEPAPFIYERVGERYRNYLIDEFQDTSVLQWQNLLPLVENALATDQFNLIVGDGKQAIYRWRSGEVEQFAKLPQIHRPADYHQDVENALVRNFDQRNLDTNFRSLRDVVEFNNFFFAHLAQTHLTASYRGIYEGAEQKVRDGKSGGFVSVKLLEDSDELSEKYLEEVELTIEDARRDGFELKDIAILVRRNKTGSEIAQYLMDKGIEVISSESLLVKRSPEVRFIVDIFKHVRDPRDNTPKAAIIRYLSGKLETEKSFNQLVHQFALQRQERGAPPIILLDQFLDAFGFKLSLSRLLQQPVYQSAEEIIRIFKLNEYSNAYLQFFLDAVHQYSARFGSSSADFLDWWEEKQDSFSVAVPQGRNAVQVMTIHKSKGLQFPVVIVPHTDWMLTPTKSHLWIELDDPIEDLAVGLVRNSKSLEETNFEQLYEDEHNKTMLDHINMLYVAFTRPEERLYVLSKNRPKRNGRYVCDLIAEAVEAHPDWNEGMGELQYGFPMAPVRTDDDQTEVFELNHLHSEPWMSKLRVSLQAPDVWDFDTMDQQQRGNVLTHALQKLEDFDQIDEVCHDLVMEGLLSEEEEQALQQQLSTLMEDASIAKYFEPGQEVQLTTELLTTDGEALNPHRLLRHEDGIITIVQFIQSHQATKEMALLKAFQRSLQQMNLEYRELLMIAVDTAEITTLQ